MSIVANLLKAPSELAALLAGYNCVQNDVGRSGSRVYRCEKNGHVLYLKIAPASEEMRRERDLLVWLRHKVPAPLVWDWHEKDGLSYLLTTECEGHMACDMPGNCIHKPAEKTIERMAEGLRMLQAVDIQDCPYDNALDKKLASALWNIENGKVDMADFADNGKFDTLMALYHWLAANKPPEELCFTHGDYCLPNVFIDDEKVAGFIDLGSGGIADRYQDIMMCIRSIGYNSQGLTQAEQERLVALLFTHLGIEPNKEKLEYYRLLDELF